MQLGESDLLKAYRTMKMIREFEERIHLEFATGDIPGFVHLYAGEEAIATRYLHAPRRPRQDHQHPSRPRPLYCQRVRRLWHDGRDLRQEERPLRRQGRLDAHR